VTRKWRVLLLLLLLLLLLQQPRLNLLSLPGSGLGQDGLGHVHPIGIGLLQQHEQKFLFRTTALRDGGGQFVGQACQGGWSRRCSIRRQLVQLSIRIAAIVVVVPQGTVKSRRWLRMTFLLLGGKRRGGCQGRSIHGRLRVRRQ